LNSAPALNPSNANSWPQWVSSQPAPRMQDLRCGRQRLGIRGRAHGPGRAALSGPSLLTVRGGRAWLEPGRRHVSL
jgi:hypothetical protein